MKLVICFPDKLSHYSNCGISFISVYDYETQSLDSYPISLTDIKNVELPKIEGPCFVFNKRLFDLHYSCESYDIETQYWLKSNKQFSNLDLLNKFLYFYKNYEDAYRYIPFYIYRTLSEKVIDIFLSVSDSMTIDKDTLFYNNNIFPSLTTIEKNGLFVDLDSFNTLFNKSYSDPNIKTLFNLHTSTGRPSNSYDNINYNALNKSDGSRVAFTSRFDGGSLVEYDFEAYHLELISKLIGFSKPSDRNMHDILGQIYFKTDKLNREQYTQSKKLSFKYLYSEDENLPKIDFFIEVDEFKKKLWGLYKENREVRSPISYKKIFYKKDMTRSKLFNYFLQMIETDFSILFINDINSLIKRKQKLSKVVLYTYDSILIDYNPLDGYDFLKEIKKLLLKSKIHMGKNYRDMIDVSESF